ncbi:MAG: NAD(P)H-hydrate epimerase [Chitinophagaceae bacterium]|nr:NAD(P)H-hydrate epimerase [Chitinophagaceae bacterium]
MIPVLSAEVVRAWDAYTIQHEPIASIDLMERAATRCFEWICSKWNYNHTFNVFCGNGNNGGDGLAIARLLFLSNYKVSVYILPEGNRSPDNQINYNRLCAIAEHVVHSMPKEIAPSKDVICIDALLGTGLTQGVKEPIKTIINQMNQVELTMVSIDLPSGMNSDHFSSHETMVKANYTLTFQCYKPAFLSKEAEQYCGEITVLDIGLHPRFLEKEIKKEDNLPSSY